MTIHPVDFLYAHLGVRMVDEFTVLSTANAQLVVCSCCGRHSNDWDNPREYVRGESYGTEEDRCLGCHTLFHGSFRYLGQEGFRGTNPTPHKLGMLKGCGAVISASSSVLYAPKKYFPKFIACKELIFDEVVDLGGMGIILDVLNRNLEPPYLFINNFGVKKSDLVSNLSLTADKSELHVCSESELLILPATFSSLSAVLLRADKKIRAEWLGLFQRSCTDYLDIEQAHRINELTMSIPGLYDVLVTLPADPHIRKKLASLIGATND